MKTAAIILAGGKGSRMKSDIPKQYRDLCGKPVLYYSLCAFEESTADGVILVVGEGEEAYCREEIVKRYGFRKVLDYVTGGKERFDSVWNGLCALKERQPETVLIHDGARPFVTSELIQRLISQTECFGACVAGMPVKDTIQITDENGVIVQTPNRSRLWTAQTPQAFSFSVVYPAYEAFVASGERDATDDAMVVGRYAHIPVRMVEGSYENIKITTPEDLDVAKILLSKR